MSDAAENGAPVCEFAHLSETNLDAFRDDAVTDRPPRCCCGPHAIVFGEVPDPGCPVHGGGR